MLITTPLSGGIYVGPDLDLHGDFVPKTRLKLLRTYNAAGKGLISFDPDKKANALSMLRYGMVLYIQAKAIITDVDSTYFEFPNLTLTAGGDNTTDFVGLGAALQVDTDFFV